MSKYLKYKTANFLKGKVFVGVDKASISKEDKSFINDVLLSTDFPEKFEISELIKTISLVDSNYEYDSYKFENEGFIYCLKINEDDEDNILKREFDNLKTLENKPIAPKPVYFQQTKYSDSLVNILVVTFELSESFEDIPNKQIEDNSELLAYNLSFIHEFTQYKKENQSEIFVSKIIEDSYIPNIVPEKILLDISKQIPNYEKYLSLIKELGSDLSQELQNLNQENFCLCHTNLKKSRILMRDNFIKFINFQYSYFLDPFFDIALLLLFTGLGRSKNIQESFLRRYISSHQKIYMDFDLALDKLNKYKDFCYKIVLLRLSAEFIFELCLHGNHRPNRIIKFIKTYEFVRPYLEKRKPEYLEYCDDFYYLIK